MHANQSDGTGTISRKFVKLMAKKFEQISTDSYISSHEANFKQCNWWLDMPTSATCFDDLGHDPQAQTTEDQAGGNHQYGIVAPVTHAIAFETGEIANEFYSSVIGGGGRGDETDGLEHKPLSIDNHPDKVDFLQQINQCLRFTTAKTSHNEDNNEKIRFDRPSDMVSHTEPNEETLHSLPVIVPSAMIGDTANRNSLTSTISQTSSSSSHSPSSRTSQTSFNSMSSVSSGQITNTVEELLYNEETYIRSLNHGINGYMKNFHRKGMPASLRGQLYRIFGNVHRIKDFHENIFFPALRQCNMDIVKICNTFCDYIEKDYFYIYISYAINRKKSEKLCIMQSAYFKQIQDEIGDKLGVNSFLVQPIQRLPKYRLLLGQLFSELGKRFGVHDDSIKSELGACCLAEKRIQRILNILDGSVEISDIVDCESPSFDTGANLRTLSQTCTISFNKTQTSYQFLRWSSVFYLNLRWCPKVGASIDGRDDTITQAYADKLTDHDLHTLCQGKFILVDRFEIYEKSDQRRRYKGKVFLFEKCIIYTELFSKNRLQYRGHFRHVSLGFTFEDQRNYFRLYNERKGNQETEFSADAQTIQTWIQMLNRTMTAVVQQEKKKIKESCQSSSVRSDLSPLQLLLQNSTPILQNIVMSPNPSEGADSQSNSTDPSYRNTGDYSNAETISIKSGRSVDSQLKRTTWYTEFDDERRLIERFQNSEKFYIQLLNNAATTYLNDLPDDLRATLSVFLDTFDKIVKFHADTFYPKLLQCELKIIAICDSIKTHLDHLEFNIYFEYAAYVHEALQMIQNHHLNAEQNFNQSVDDPSFEIESLLLMPVKHISNYAQFVDGIFNDYKTRSLLDKEFKTIAAVEIEIKKLQKMVSENLALSSMRGSICIARKFGIITYSDEIYIDFTKCRIMILEMGLVCVRTRLSTKTKKEKFTDILFSIPILNIELHENDAYPRKMKIIAENEEHVNNTVTFATTGKKKQFMVAIRKQRNVKVN